MVSAKYVLEPGICALLLIATITTSHRSSRDIDRGRRICECELSVLVLGEEDYRTGNRSELERQGQVDRKQGIKAVQESLGLIMTIV